MLRAFKVLILVALSLAAVEKASAFALGGSLDGEAWQVPTIGYRSTNPLDFWGDDVASPRNFSEEYRWNTPIVYYAFDSSFIDYFGSNGIAALDQGMAMFNALTNVSSYTNQLTEFPLDSARVNLRAQALYLLDLKSEMLTFMLEELGLLSAERWTWCLRDRVVGVGGCPNDVTYDVYRRNWDPVTVEPSSYVNGALFSYFIIDNCIPPPPIISDAYEFPVDPLRPSTGMAAYSLLQTMVGRYYTGFSRDDVGGLRYLWSTNNRNTEAVDSQATLIHSTSTNGSYIAVITTSNLLTLNLAAATNTPAQLLAMFPNLVLSSSNSWFEVVVSSNTVAYYTNSPYSIAGTPASLVVATVYSTNFQQRYQYTFDNLITYQCYSNTTFSVITSNAAVQPYSIPGSTNLTTTVSVNSQVLPIPSCDYFILPSNVCNFEIIANLTLVGRDETTVTATNGTATNVDGQTYTVTTATYYTNHSLLVRFAPCAVGTGTNATALRQGMEKMRFVRANYDSLLGQLFVPITTNYTLNSVTGSKVFVDTYRRTITQPDIVFTAEDMGGGAGLSRSIPQWVQGPAPGGAGPGIIQAPVSITFDKGGHVYGNSSPYSLDQATASQYTWWGSFDGRTNDPVVYPSGTSLRNLEDQVLMQIVPSTLPNGTNGVSYNVSLNGNGGQPPYTMSLSVGSPGLPPGLVLTNSPGWAIVGTPTEAGTFDFSLNMQDSSNRQVDWSYSIIVE